jgi:ubiquinone/menaquinone biosynthesis C-methylase UbiE
MSEERKHRVCPVEHAGVLDIGLRKLFQDPQRILSPFVREGMAALDLGCGPGYFTLGLARLVGPAGRVTAADLQEGMLAKARSKLATAGLAERVSFHLGGADAIGLPPASRFDFALAFYMLHEVPEPLRFLGEVRSLLKPGGRFLAAEPKWHVTREAFQATIGLMTQAGFAVLAEPAIRFSRAVLLG